MQKAARSTVLIVGSYPALLSSRAALLQNCDTSTSSVEDALSEILIRRYDLVLVCQTMPDEAAEELAALARALHPDIQLLIYSYPGQPRDLEVTAKYLEAPSDARQLQSVVYGLLG